MAHNNSTRDSIERLDSVWKAPGFIPTLIAVAGAFGAWSLLLPVVPTAVLDSGGDATLAGATTGIFMLATVITQLLTPSLLRAVGYNPVMVVSAFLLGVPALGHMLGTDPFTVLLFSAIRGVGFGAVTVAESALIAELVPARFLGKATGLLGVSIGISQMVFLPIGLAMVEPLGYNSVYILAAVVALLAAVMCLRIPPTKASRTLDPPGGQARTRAPMWKLILVPALALTTVSMMYGLISSFLPALIREADPTVGAMLGGMILSVVGGVNMVSRYGAGIIADRRGRPGLTMIPAQITSLIGVGVIIAVILTDASMWWMMVAAILYGLGFGAVQNESLLSMFHRLPRSKYSEASAAYNIFFDGGTGLGSVVLGMVVGASGYPGAFAAGAFIIALGIVMSLLDYAIGARRLKASTE